MYRRPQLRRRLSPAVRGRLWQTANYLAATETQTYAASVAAHSLLSFFPFIVLLLSVSRNVLHSERLYNGLLLLISSYLPVADTPTNHTRTFILNNLRAIVELHGKVQFVSLFILLITCTGIFMPLEVALNRIWGAPRNRNYMHNWLVAIGMAFTSGVLGLLSASFTAMTETYSTRLAHFLAGIGLFHFSSVPALLNLATMILIRIGALPITISMFFLVYWLLPNAHISPRRVLPAAITAGLLWEASKYIYILLLPWLNFADIYGPFAISVSLLIWAFVSALILLTATEVVAIPLLEPPAPAMTERTTSPLGLGQALRVPAGVTTTKSEAGEADSGSD